MLIKCSVCGADKEDTDFNRVKGKCNTCCYSQEYNKIKEKMGNTDGGEIVYLKKVILSKAKKRSKKKNLEFNLTLGDLINIKNNTCPILGHEILYKSGIDNKRSASLDRIDPNKGYIKGNVKIVSSEGNLLKNRNNYHSAVKMLEYIIKNSPPEDMAPEKRDELLNLLKYFN
jgi:hypothetical protein